MAANSGYALLGLLPAEAVLEAAIKLSERILRELDIAEAEAPLGSAA